MCWILIIRCLYCGLSFEDLVIENNLENKMAKQYVKPMISFEKLAISSNGSAGCAFDAEFAPFSCPVHIPGWGDETIFNAGTCTWYNEDDSVCYHVPTESTNIFGS